MGSKTQSPPEPIFFTSIITILKSGNAVEIVAQINPHFFAEVSHSRALFLVTSFNIQIRQ